jgi:hypothetical protein
LRIIRVKWKLIFASLLLLTLPLLLGFYLFSRPIPATESPWKIITGNDKITSFEFLSWFDQDARLYTLSNNNKAAVLAPSSPFYVFPWLPQGKKEGRYVWNLTFNPTSLNPILYENFMALNPQFPGELPKQLKNFLQQQLDYELAKNPPSAKMVMEVIKFSTGDKDYEARLSVTDFKKLNRRRFGTEFMDTEPKGWHTGVYYSGTLIFEVFSLSESTQPIVALQKQFRDWNYPLRRNDFKLVQPSFIGAFCKLYFLSDSQPVLMIFSKVYRGVYQVRQGIDDAKFSVIIP